MIRKKKNLGFTLLEIMLTVGIIAIISIGIYSFYNKQSENAKIVTLTNYLNVIDSSLKNSFSSSTDFTLLNNSFLINSNIIPTEMVQNTTTINNLFGGQIVLASATVSAVPGYSLTFDKISPDVCTKLSTTQFSAKVQEIVINGTTVKTANGPLTPTQIAQIAANCVNTNNTIVFRDIMINPNMDAIGNPNASRSKELPVYIPTIGNPSTSGASSTCAGGTTWNGSFCSCPINTEWNGNACIAFGTTTQPGWCPRGQGWLPGTRTCAALPNGSSSNIYSEGRNLPASITTGPVQNATDPTQSITGKTIPAAKSEVIAGKTIMSPEGQLDNTSVQVCVNGIWNATANRCVTP